MRSPVDEGANSTRRLKPLSMKPQGMLNTYRIMKQLWTPTHDDKARKREGHFDVDNLDECRSKMHCLFASANGFLKEDQLQMR